MSIPLWIGKYLPLLDLPQHLAIATVFLRHADPTWTLAPYFEPQPWELTPYWGHYVALVGLGRFMPVDTAARVFLTLYVMALPFAAMALARALGRTARMGLLALPLALNANLYYGFIAYCASTVLLFWAIALLARQVEAPSLPRAAGIAALAAAIFFTHVQSFAFLLLAAPLLAACGNAPVKGVRRAWPLVPATLGLFLPWLYLSTTPQPGADRYFPALDETRSTYASTWERLAGIPGNIAGSFQDASDDALLATWALAVGAAALASRGEAGPAPDRRALALLLAALACYFLPAPLHPGPVEHLAALRLAGRPAPAAARPQRAAVDPRPRALPRRPHLGQRGVAPPGVRPRGGALREGAVEDPAGGQGPRPGLRDPRRGHGALAVPPLRAIRGRAGRRGGRPLVHREQPDAGAAPARGAGARPQVGIPARSTTTCTGGSSTTSSCGARPSTPSRCGPARTPWRRSTAAATGASTGGGSSTTPPGRGARPSWPIIGQEEPPWPTAARRCARRSTETAASPRRSTSRSSAYAPGSPERAELKARLKAMAGERVDIPLVIGGQGGSHRRDRHRDATRPRHVLADWHKARAGARRAGHRRRRRTRTASGPNWPWEDRARGPPEGGRAPDHDLAATINAATMLGQSKTAFQAEIDAACERIDFWRFNPAYAQELVRRAAAVRPHDVEPARLPPAGGLRLRGHAVQLHVHRRQPPHRARAHGQHRALEAGLHGGALR